MESLASALGQSFEVQDYGTSHIALASGVANMNVRCSSAGTVVISQQAMDAPVLLRELTPVVWDAVAETLGVRGRVQRVGVRYWFVFPFATPAEAWAELSRGALAAPTETWRMLFGDPVQANFIGVTTSGDETTRVAFAVVENRIQATLPEWFSRAAAERYAPPVSLLLDLDYGRQSQAEFSLGRHALEGRMTETWVHARTCAIKVAGVLAQRKVFGDAAT